MYNTLPYSTSLASPVSCFVSSDKVDAVPPAEPHRIC